MGWRRTSFFKTTKQTMGMWKELYHEWKLYFECLFFYIRHYRIFRYQKRNFNQFLWQMRYFIIVDPNIKSIKSLWGRMQNLEHVTEKQRRTDRAMITALSPSTAAKEFLSFDAAFKKAKEMQDDD